MMRVETFRPLLIFLAVVIIAVVVSGVYKKFIPSQSSSSASINSKTFTSSSLGVAFRYLQKQGDQTITVLETGNKICVTYDSNDKACSKGQYVEVFRKNPTDMLADSIKKQFLTEYSPRDCFVDTTFQTVQYPSNFETAVISFPKATDPEAPWWENADKCPPVYTATNGIAYFLQDKNHPGKFLFFNIGQYAISAADSVSWNQTIKIQD